MMFICKIENNFLTTSSADDVHSKVFIEESKVLYDYLNHA